MSQGNFSNDIIHVLFIIILNTCMSLVKNVRKHILYTTVCLIGSQTVSIWFQYSNLVPTNNSISILSMLIICDVISVYLYSNGKLCIKSILIWAVIQIQCLKNIINSNSEPVLSNSKLIMQSFSKQASHHCPGRS